MGRAREKIKWRRKMEEVLLFTALRNEEGKLCLRIAGSSEDLFLHLSFWLGMIDKMEEWIEGLGRDGPGREHGSWYQREKKLLEEKIKLILEYLLKRAKEDSLNVPLAADEKCPACGCPWIINARNPIFKKTFRSIMFFTFSDRLCLVCGKKWSHDRAISELG